MSDEMQNDQERRILAFDRRRKKSQNSKKDKTRNVVILDKDTCKSFEQNKLEEQRRQIPVFYTGNEVEETTCEPDNLACDLDELITDNNKRDKTLSSLDEKQFQLLASESNGLTSRDKNNPIKTGPYMFYNEMSAEEERMSFTRSKSDASSLVDPNRATEKLIRTNTKLVKHGHGLTNRDDPSQISFQEESEWLERLVLEALETNKHRDLSKVKKRRSLDFLSYGLPITPSSHDATSSRNSIPKEKFKVSHQPSKNDNVVEQPIKLTNRKSWLENLVKRGNHEVPPREEMHNRNVNLSTSNDGNDHILKNASTTDEITSQEDVNNNGDSRKFPQSVYYPLSPHLFLEKEKEKVKKDKEEPVRKIRKDVVSESTKIEEAMSPVDDENRGNAYMLPSALRKQKSVNKEENLLKEKETNSVKERRALFFKELQTMSPFKESNGNQSKNKDTHSKKISCEANIAIETKESGSSNGTLNFNESDAEVIAQFPSVKQHTNIFEINTNATNEVRNDVNIESIVRSNVEKVKSTVPNDVVPKKMKQLSQIEKAVSEDNECSVPSIKEKLEMFRQKQSSTADDVTLRKKHISKNRPKSYAGRHINEFIYVGKEFEEYNSSQTKQANYNEKVTNIGMSVMANDNNNNNNGGRIIFNSEAKDYNNNSKLKYKNINDDPAEYKYLVKDQRILQEIAETEKREEEIRANRENINMNSDVEKRGRSIGLQAFLQENEFHVL